MSTKKFRDQEKGSVIPGDLLIVRSPDGWSLYAPDATDDDIANGVPLAHGLGDGPEMPDYVRAVFVWLALSPSPAARVYWESQLFLRSGESRGTSREIMAAIWILAGENETLASRIHDKPGHEDRVGVWQIATDAGRVDARMLRWGVTGAAWASDLGAHLVMGAEIAKAVERELSDEFTPPRDSPGASQH